MCGLVSIPIAVKYLGKDEIGLWAVINSFVSYLLWMDFGVGEATGRKMADAIAHEDGSEINRWWTTSLTVLSIQGILMLLIGIAIAPWLGRFLRLDGRIAGDANFLFLGAVTVAALGMPMRAYPGILLAQERFHWIPFAQGLMPWVQLAVFAVQLRCGWGVRSYMLAVTASWLAGWLVLFIQAHRGRERFAFDASGLTRDRLTSLFHYSGSIALNGIVTSVMQSLPALMIARLGGVGTVPVYTFSSTGPGMLRTLTARTAHSFYPNLQRMYVTRETDRFATKYRAVNLLALGMSLVAAGAILAGNRFLVEWLADPDFFAGHSANGLLAISVIVLTLLASFTDLLQISGSMGRIAILSLLQLAAGVAFTWLGYQRAGLPGLIAAVSLTPLVFQGFYALLRGASYCRMSAWRLGGSITLLAAGACGLVAAASWWLNGTTVDTETITLLHRTTRLPTVSEWTAGGGVAGLGLLLMVRQVLQLKRL